MTSPVTFLSFNCLALSSFPTFTLDRAATLPAGFFTISTSCCNDSGDPGFWATCKLELVRNCATHHDERPLHKMNEDKPLPKRQQDCEVQK